MREALRVPVLMALLGLSGCAGREDQAGLDQVSEPEAISPVQADSARAASADTHPPLEKQEEPLSGNISRYDHLAETYAKRYGFDCRLILAQIKHESQFDPYAVSPAGARGLMQIMPYTAQSLGLEDIHDPRANIAAGVRYLRKQYDIFKEEKEPDRIWFALASYHAGFGRILDAQKIAEHLGLRPDKWVSIKVALPKLTPRYKSIHQAIWRGPRPQYGFYYGAGKTIAYVENIERTYAAYREPSRL